MIKTYICPKCRSSNVDRVPRMFWMRLFVNHIRIYCLDCQSYSMIDKRPANPK